MIDGRDSERSIALVLRWTLIERGTATLADSLGPSVVVPEPPRRFLPEQAAVCGPVVLLRRQRAEPGEPPRSSYGVVGQVARQGSVIMIRADPDAGAGFGSGVALRAAHGGAVALVTDGAWRDTGRLSQLALPVGANGVTPARPAGHPVVPSDAEEMFGVTWRNGDWFLRDADGAVRLTADAAHAYAASLLAQLDPELLNVLAGA